MKNQNVGGLLPALFVSLLGLAGCVSNQPKQETQQVQEAPVAAEKKAEAVAPVDTRPTCANVPERSGKAAKKKNTKEKNAKATQEPVRDCVPAAERAAAKPASVPVAAAAPAKANARGGYDLSKNKPVTDSSKVESGQGTTVTGLNDWQGEITGLPAANSRFTQLRIGMPQQQVLDLAGQPTDQGAYVTGKAFIPFYFGSDKTRWEMVYKGQGRLIFSNQAGFGSGHYLTWIIHNANEGGYR